jgi:hypothetical protein
VRGELVGQVREQQAALGRSPGAVAAGDGLARVRPPGNPIGNDPVSRT